MLNCIIARPMLELKMLQIQTTTQYLCLQVHTINKFRNSNIKGFIYI